MGWVGPEQVAMAEEAFSVLAPQAGARQESYRAGTLVVLLRLHWFIRLRSSVSCFPPRTVRPRCC